MSDSKSVRSRDLRASKPMETRKRVRQGGETLLEGGVKEWIN